MPALGDRSQATAANSSWIWTREVSAEVRWPGSRTQFYSIQPPQRRWNRNPTGRLTAIR